MPPFRIVANFILFQIAWFVGILAPLGWASTIVALIIAAHLWLFAAPREWRLIVLTMLIGGVWDTLLSAIGIFNFNPTTTFWSPLIVPLWLLLLWGNFAMALCHSLCWLRNYKIIAAIAGGLIGPAAYLSGAALTDKLTIAVSAPLFFAVSAPFWAIVCATLPQLGKRITATNANK